METKTEEPTTEEILEALEDTEELEESTRYEAGVQVGEIKINGYETPQFLCGLMINMLKNNSVKKYLKVLEERKTKALPTYTE